LRTKFISLCCDTIDAAPHLNHFAGIFGFLVFVWHHARDALYRSIRCTLHFPAQTFARVLRATSATTFIGREGHGRLIHCGFAVPAGDIFNGQLKDEFASTVERLLAESSEERASASASQPSGR
jgi:hypothetical protein